MNILYPTDFSVTAQKAHTLALDIGERLHAPLHVVYVQKRFETDVPPYLSQTIDGLSSELRAQLQRARAEEERHLNERLASLTPEGGSYELLWGEPLRELLALLPRYDLVVMGAHGAGRLDAAFVGGVAGRLVRRSPVPVLSVREEATTKELNRILVATDFGDASKHAWRWCGRFAKKGVKLVAAHIIDDRHLQDNPDYVRVASEALEQFSGNEDERQVLREGNPVRELPLLAEEVGADAIAVGMRRHSGSAGLLQGSRADALLRSSPVPILSVPFAPQRLSL